MSTITVNFIDANKSIARNAAYAVVLDDRAAIAFIPVDTAKASKLTPTDIKKAFAVAFGKDHASLSQEKKIELAQNDLKVIAALKGAL